MSIILSVILLFIAIYILYKLFSSLEQKRSRTIPEYIKQKVLQRYFNMCAVCSEKNLLEYHHRVDFANGGENTEENIVPICPKHHAMVTRLDE